MKKLVLFTGVILMACVIVSSLIVPVNAQQNTQSYISAESSATSASNAYVLKENGGRIAVFVKGQAEPVITTDTMVNILPEEDQQALEDGVEVYGERALQKALEDYCS